MWSVDEKRNLINCILKKDKKKELFIVENPHKS
jgi:hypothetical protein